MKYLPEGVSKAFAKQLLTIEKHSPHILFVAGIAGVVTSTVLACRATLKLDKTLDNIKTDVDRAKNDVFQPYLSHHSKHVDAEIELKRSLARAYGRGGFEVAKLYAPAVIIGTASLAALTKSHVTMTQRNQALTAAYVTVTKAFSEYRDRVRKEVGEERELELYHDGKFEIIKGENGEDIKVLKKTDGPGGLYTRVFDESNRNWVNNAESTRLFLEANERYFNDRLRTYHHVFLNEVLDNLGFERVPEGQLVGWVYGSETGDNFIDFGIYDMINADFAINGDRTVVLDFNVDGVIYNLI